MLISSKVPVKVRLLLPLPVTLTPPPAVAVSVPEGTLKLTVMLPTIPASKSNALMPSSPTLVSSLVMKLPGRLFNGASLTANMVMMLVSVSISIPPTPVLPPSLVVIVSVTLPLKLNTGL